MNLNDLKAVWARVSYEDKQGILLVLGFITICVTAGLAIAFLIVEELLMLGVALVVLSGLKMVIYNPLMKAWREHDESVRTLEERYPSENRKNSTGTSTESNSE